jgi:hypothetical protein
MRLLVLLSAPRFSASRIPDLETRIPELRLPLKYLPQEWSCTTAAAFDQAREVTLVKYFSACVPALRPDFNYVISFRDEVEMMFNYDYCVPLIDQSVKDVDKFFAIAEVEPDGWFFEDIKIRPYNPMASFAKALQSFRQFTDQFQPLGFAAREGGAALAEGEVSQACFHHQPEDLLQPAVKGEKSSRFLESHGEDFSDILSFPQNVLQF